MAQKRPNESQSTDESLGRNRKKQKTDIARTIAVQPDVGPSTSRTPPEAGPSKSVRFDSEWLVQYVEVALVSCRTSCGGMKGLPGALDVEKFAEVRVLSSWEVWGLSHLRSQSRAFEINAMRESMQNARLVSTLVSLRRVRSQPPSTQGRAPPPVHGNNFQDIYGAELQVTMFGGCH